MRQMKIGRQLRNLLLRQDDTLAIDSNHCLYRGEKYTYPIYTLKEIQDIKNHLLELIK